MRSCGIFTTAGKLRPDSCPGVGCWLLQGAHMLSSLAQGAEFTSP